MNEDCGNIRTLKEQTILRVLPVNLVYTEYYERIDEAFAREKQIQKWSRKKKEALINGDIAMLRYLSKSNNLCLSKSHFDKLSDQISDKNKVIKARCLSLSNGRCLSLSKAHKNQIGFAREDDS